MAGFKTHVTTSTAIGVAYGAGALAAYHVPWPSCVLAGGLCGVAGMLPDLDSEPGVPLRESVSFAAAVVPMLMIQRWQQLELSRESIVLISGCLYLLIRFGFGHLLSSLTVHRGMFHSLPALAIVGQLTYLVCSHEDVWTRCFFAVAVMCGFASHLVLDEIWSLDLKHLRVKSSFGTAVKLWGDCWWANLFTYANVVVLTLLITQDRVPPGGGPLPGNAEMIAKQPSDRVSLPPARIAGEAETPFPSKAPRSR